MAIPEDAPEATGKRFGNLNLSITGIGIEYPVHLLDAKALDTLCQRHYPDSPAFVLTSPRSKNTTS